MCSLPNLRTREVFVLIPKREKRDEICCRSRRPLKTSYVCRYTEVRPSVERPHGFGVRKLLTIWIPPLLPIVCTKVHKFKFLALSVSFYVWMPVGASNSRTLRIPRINQYSRRWVGISGCVRILKHLAHTHVYNRNSFCEAVLMFMWKKMIVCDILDLWMYLVERKYHHIFSTL